MADNLDPTVNHQAQRPGEVEPQRTPGSAPSVVPLPDGADPDAKRGEHPLPEQAIENYPPIADLYGNSAGSGPDGPPAEPDTDAQKAAPRSTRAPKPDGDKPAK